MTPNLMTLYVENIEQSTNFYENLFNQPPVAVTPNYVAFQFDHGLFVSLWSKQAKNFISDGTGNRFELSFMVQDRSEVKSIFDKWCSQSVKIEQPLEEAVFGLTFVALDPDGHRIRVCMPDG